MYLVLPETTDEQGSVFLCVQPENAWDHVQVFVSGWGKCDFYSSENKFYILAFQNAVRLIHQCDFYPSKYGMQKFLVDWDSSLIYILY